MSKLKRCTARYKHGHGWELLKVPVDMPLRSAQLVFADEAEAEIARLRQTLEETVAILEGFLTEDSDDPVVMAYETAQKALGEVSGE